MIPEGQAANFQTLLRAARADRLALMECKDAKTGEPRYVICAVGDSDGGGYTMTPFGHMYDGDPFDPFGAYIPPDPNEP